MTKIVFLLAVVSILFVLFGANISVLFGSISNGAGILFNTLGIFTDFFGRLFSAMFTQAYVINLFSVFLFIQIFVAVIYLLRSGGLSDDFDNEETSKNNKRFKKYKKGKKLRIISGDSNGE